jgi:hypothetical protein
MSLPLGAVVRLGQRASDIADTQGTAPNYPIIGDGDGVIIAGSVSDDEARTLYPDGWQAPRPYIRIVPQPNGSA